MRLRTMLLRIIVMIVFTIMAGRLAWFQIVKADDIVAREEEYRIQKQAITPVRGALKDRAGRFLAVSIPVRTVVASPRDMGEKNFAEVAEELAQHLPLTAEEIQQRFAKNPASQFVVLAEGIDLQVADEIIAKTLPGISLVPGAKRTYPQGSAANQLIGWLSYEGDGAYGLEAQYNEQLKGKQGFVRAELTHGSTPIEGTIKSQIPAEPGVDLTLTVDAYLNQTFEAALDRVVKEQEAKRALAIAMDVHTGEILAMAMRPGADLTKRDSWFTPDGKLDVDRLYNWGLTPLPPGSIFKTITTAIALEERAIDLNTLIEDSGRLTLDGWTITNWDQYVPVQPKPMTIAELMQNSSNVGLVQVGQRIPHETFIKYLQGFGFMDTTGIDFPGESGAVGLAGFEQKSGIDWANMYIGQHLEVTPLQMVRAVAAIANGGQLVQPHLVKEMRGPDGELRWRAETKPIRQVITEETAKEVRDVMLSVVEKGTGNQAQIPGYWVGGKTGTAQKFEGGREKARGLGDFIGFAPASNPQVVLMVLVDEPKPPGYGGMIAAPLFRELMPHVLRTLAIPPDKPVDPKVTAAEQQAAQAADTAQSPVPDVRFLPIAWAEQRLKDSGFAPKSVGQGTVVIEQSVKGGGPAKAGTVVELKLGPRPAEKIQVPDFRGLTLVEANRLAAEVGITLKQAGGSGFVVEQGAAVGAELVPDTVLTVRLSSVRPGQP